VKNRREMERKTEETERNGRSALFNSDPVWTGITNRPDDRHLRRPSGRALITVWTRAV